MLDKAGQHPKELNPYWKENGTGLPSATPSLGGQRKSEGRSWILRSYKRALEQAKEKNVPFERIAEKQWGSVDKIYSLLRSVGIDPERPDSQHACRSKEYLYSRSKHDRESSREHVGFQPPRKQEERDKQKLSSSRRSKPFVCPGRDDVEMSMDMVSLNRGAWKKADSAMSLPPPVSPQKEQVSQPSYEVAAVSEPSVQEELVTESMINAKSAKLIKAELMGNQKKIKQLKEEIEVMRATMKSQQCAKAGNRSAEMEERVVVLTTTDRFGRVRPADVPPPGPHMAPKPRRENQRCLLIQWMKITA